jgi:hypothetical protein
MTRYVTPHWFMTRCVTPHPPTVHDTLRHAMSIHELSLAQSQLLNSPRCRHCRCCIFRWLCSLRFRAWRASIVLWLVEKPHFERTICHNCNVQSVNLTMIKIYTSRIRYTVRVRYAIPNAKTLHDSREIWCTIRANVAQFVKDMVHHPCKRCTVRARYGAPSVQDMVHHPCKRCIVRARAVKPKMAEGSLQTLLITPARC